MYDKYINYFGKNQVINNINIVVNNYTVYEEAEQKQKSGKTEREFSEADADEEAEREKRICQKRKIDWDLAEDFEENINDIKEKYLPSKLKTLKLENVYAYLKNYSSMVKLHQCGTYLEFTIKRNETINKKKFKRAFCCKKRLCPFCSWRRSLRIFSNVLRCYDEIIKFDFQKKTESRSRFILITLTTRNVAGEDLKREIDDILRGFKRLSDYKRFKDAFSGYVRALEITCDREPYITKEMYNQKRNYYLPRGLRVGDENPNYMYFNVHIHVLCHTTYKRYSENYISQKELTELWQKALRIDYEPIVDIRSFKAKNKETKGRELAEIAKYTVKPMDYLRAEYQERKNNRIELDSEFILDSKVIFYLDGALSGRRLLAYGGTFKKAHQKLNLDDENLFDDKDLDVGEEYILKYFFDFERKKYKVMKDN